jgi:cardiolipin synthase A/B
MIVDWLPTPSQHFLVSAIALLIYVLTTRARDQRRAPTAAIAWVLGLALVPYLMLPLYVLFGQRKLPPVFVPYAGVVVEGPHWAAELIESFGLAPPSLCKIEMHADGTQARDALHRIIESAQHSLDVSTFIIGNDAFGRDIVARLARRAREGVQVRLLLDGFYALLLPRCYVRELRAAGAQLAVFRPFFSLRRLGPRNLRNHRKLVVADDSFLWCGGRNLAMEYFLGDDVGMLWPDLSFDLQGPVAAAAGHQFDLDWNTTQLRAPLRERQLVACSDGALAQFLPSGPDQVEDTAQSLLIAGCYRARRRLLVVTPYFVPDDSLRAAMRLAARRGVKVTVAIPQRSNHVLADFVRSRPMRDLAAAGVEFRLVPMMVHAKAVVIDETLALCGSINLDLRSLLLNHEAAVVFYGAEQIDWLARWITAMAQQGRGYRAEPPGLLRDIAEGVLLTVAFQL